MIRPAPELTCLHCGHPLLDHAGSRTGLTHAATGFSRCDGRSMGDPGLQRTTLAVATPPVGA